MGLYARGAMSPRYGRQGLKVPVEAREGWAPHMPAAPAPAPCPLTARPAAVQGYTTKPELSHGSSEASTKGICRSRLTLIQTDPQAGRPCRLARLGAGGEATETAQFPLGLRLPQLQLSNLQLLQNNAAMGHRHGRDRELHDAMAGH